MFLENGINEIENQIRSIGTNKKVVMWGLGEYAEKILKFTSLFPKISFFIDNGKTIDTFYGKKIYRPYEVEWGNIDTIIVASYYRSQEIIAEIKSITEYKGTIIELSKTWTERPFYEYESLKKVVIPSNESELSRNKIFEKNNNGNKRCFILGNGPSTREFDLGKLHDEVVFVVNDFFRYEDINKINPNYYVIMDPFYIYADSKYLINIFNVSKICPDIKFWFPINTKKEIDKIENMKHENVFYVSGSRDINTLGDYRIDLTKEIPSIQSVIHASIYMAVYMGFKEVYLLGCEETVIFYNINSYLGKYENGHSYNISSKEIKEYANEHRKVPLDDMLSGYAKIYKYYKLVNNICKMNDVELYTCAEETLVEGIPYYSYNKLFE